MARTQITAYVTSDTAETLRRLAAIDNRSISDLIEDAITRRFMDAGWEAEHAALVAKIDAVARRLRAIEAGQEAQFELTAQGTRFVMSVAPDIPEAERAALNARGGERFRNVLSIIIARLSAGQCAARDVFHGIELARDQAAAMRGAAE
jgi:hypothetical protein